METFLHILKGKKITKVLSKEEFQLLSDNYDDLRQIFDTLSTVGDAMQYIITGNSDEMPSQYMYIDDLPGRVKDTKALLSTIVNNLPGKDSKKPVTQVEMELVIMYVKSIDLLIKKLKPDDWKGISNRYNDMLFLILEIAKQNFEEDDTNA